MSAVCRASISLDGKLLTSSGKPSRGGIPSGRIEEAAELELTIYPLIVGGNAIPTLSGMLETFQSTESRWVLRSAVNGPEGTIVARYRRK
jgi:hypothetical protein